MKASILTTLLVAVLSQVAAHGAAITWNLSQVVNTGSAQNTFGTGFLSTDGDLVFAENFGGPATVFDGIPFDAGSFSLGGTASVFHANSVITDSGTFGTAGTGTAAAGTTVTIGAGAGEIGGQALIPGATYTVQLVVMDGRGNQAGRSYILDGIATDHSLGTSNVTWGNALLATGVFTADATSQSFTSQVVNPNGTLRADSQFNAIVVSIPEPSKAVLLLLGLGGSLFIRRRS